jgi:hypothetical protein
MRASQFLLTDIFLAFFLRFFFGVFLALICGGSGGTTEG